MDFTAGIITTNLMCDLLISILESVLLSGELQWSHGMIYTLEMCLSLEAKAKDLIQNLFEYQLLENVGPGEFELPCGRLNHLCC